jgi:hypothetical protein
MLSAIPKVRGHPCKKRAHGQQAIKLKEGTQQII